LERISEILKGFEPVGLEEINSVGYMSRVDTKYLFSFSKLPSLLKNVRSLYKVLEIDRQRKFDYKTVYFDTPQLSFYKQHVTGKLNRDKVRVRKYENNGLTFLEVKHKSNKGRTLKTRLEKEEGDMNHVVQSREFLEELISADASSLKAVVNTGFTRVTLVNLDEAERITIDYNISWNDMKGAYIDLPFLAIAEIKSNKSTSMSLFFQQLKKLGIRSAGFSKYATGMALLNNVTKKNSIKSKVLLLNRIKDEYNRTGTA
jgi:uncharacterized protein YcfL